MTTRAIAANGLAIMLVSLSGCGVDPETLESLQAATSTISAAQVQVSPEITKGPATKSSKSQFTPANPDRLDPFTFPSDGNKESGAGSSMTTVAEIEVLGFANVGKPHVLLRSGETVRSMQVDESIDGIRVITINPPIVQLQMGTLIWTATMFDKTDSQ